jgi:hypothetical protein
LELSAEAVEGELGAERRREPACRGGVGRLASRRGRSSTNWAEREGVGCRRDVERMSWRPVHGLPQAVGGSDPFQHVFSTISPSGCSPCANDEIGASDARGGAGVAGGASLDQVVGHDRRILRSARASVKTAVRGGLGSSQPRRRAAARRQMGYRGAEMPRIPTRDTPDATRRSVVDYGACDG